MTDFPPVWLSPGGVGGRSASPASSGEQRAGESAEAAGELFQHICRGVEPKPAAGSPRPHGGGVSPSLLKGPEERTEDLSPTGMKPGKLIGTFRMLL